MLHTLDLPNKPKVLVDTHLQRYKERNSQQKITSQTTNSLLNVFQMQHNSIVVIDKLAAKLYPSAAEVTLPAPLHLYYRREEDLVGIFCLVLPCEHDELNHHRFPIHHESLAGIITQPNRKKCRGTYL